MDGSPDRVHLPAAIEEQIGWPRSAARAAIALGKVEVDGEVYRDSDLAVPATVEMTITVRETKIGDKTYRPSPVAPVAEFAIWGHLLAVKRLADPRPRARTKTCAPRSGATSSRHDRSERSRGA